MIIKNIFRIHPFFYILICICIITGHFKDFSILMILILFHELGHILIGLYYKWNIEKIIILPFGCLTIFKTKLTIPFKQEFLVSIMGIIFQSILYLILKNFNINNLSSIHYSILLFNLLPIIPLDGFKIFNCFFNIFISFKKSYYISIFISFIFILILLFKFNLILYLIIVFLLIKTINECKNIKYLFNKFLYERKIYNFNFKKFKKISNINNMYKYYKNLVYKNNIYYTEKEIIKYEFDKFKL